MCRVLQVTPSGFYSWRQRPISKHESEDRLLKSMIQSIYKQHHGRYGAPRIQAELTAMGRCHSIKRIARLMRELNLFGKTRRRFIKTTIRDQSHPVAENTLARNFIPDTLNSVWASDITYIPTKEGWLYLAITMDLCSRTIVGWSMDGTMTAELPLKALQMAMNKRHPSGGLMHHSDQGSQYTSALFQNALQAYQMQCSMSRKGECWDNAVLESFFETLKRELIEGMVYHTRQQAQKAIFEYVEVYYNRKRRHSTLGYLTPLEFERQTRAA